MGYTFRFLKPSHPYYPAWQEYRRRRKLWILTFAGLVAAAALGQLIAMPLGYWFESDIPELVVVATIGCIGLPLVSFRTWQMVSSRCPRCARVFNWGSFSLDKCLHCGLEEYAPCDPAEQQWEFERLNPASK